MGKTYKRNEHHQFEDDTFGHHHLKATKRGINKKVEVDDEDLEVVDETVRLDIAKFMSKWK